MEKYTVFMDWKNQYSESEYTTQSDLQIQCNPYQATNGIFQRTMAPHSSAPAWKIPWTEEPGGLRSMGS